MRSKIRSIVALSGMLGILSAVAGETPIDIKTDLKGQYFLVEKGGTPEQPTLLVKRVRADAITYSKRLFDCAGHSYKDLGSGESIEAVAEFRPGEELVPVEEGTITYQLWKHACAK